MNYFIAILFTCVSLALGDILSLINQARTNPINFATNILPTLSGNFDASALQSAITDMKTRPPVGSLSQCDCLSSSAKTHSNDMSTTNRLSYIGTDGSDSSQRIDASCGEGYFSEDENIAMSSTPNDSQFVAMWIVDANTPGVGNRESIMNGNYQFIGIGQSGNYITIDFSSNCGYSPASQSTAPPSATATPP